MVKIFRFLLCVVGTIIVLFLCGYHVLLENVPLEQPIAGMVIFPILFISTASWLAIEAYLSLRRENEKLWEWIEWLESARQKGDSESEE